MECKLVEKVLKIWLCPLVDDRQIEMENPILDNSQAPCHQLTPSHTYIFGMIANDSTFLKN